MYTLTIIYTSLESSRLETEEFSDILFALLNSNSKANDVLWMWSIKTLYTSKHILFQNSHAEMWLKLRSIIKSITPFEDIALPIHAQRFVELSNTSLNESTLFGLKAIAQLDYLCNNPIRFESYELFLKNLLDLLNNTAPHEMFDSIRDNIKNVFVQWFNESVLLQSLFTKAVISDFDKKLLLQTHENASAQKLLRLFFSQSEQEEIVINHAMSSNTIYNI